MRKLFFLSLSLLLIVAMAAACGAPAAPAPAAPAAAEQPAQVEQPAAAAPAATGGRVQIRWFVGLGTGSSEDQIPAQEAVIKRFNESQDRIELVAEFVPNASARDVLATQIASGSGPDIVGPVGWSGSNA
ncbi:MAG: hypothetical protein NZ553_17695, partial [Caldilinea sp.]|nr:hypothetical protein [Caldilinea sp.]MDW8442316.1 hypothetical protein [Caldilineaceae bacterium]